MIGGKRVLDINYTLSDGDVWEAWLILKPEDAQLICAAPELFEACKAVVVHADKRAQRHAIREGALALADGLAYSETATPEEPAFVTLCRDAIRKAQLTT